MLDLARLRLNSDHYRTRRHLGSKPCQLALPVDAEVDTSGGHRGQELLRDHDAREGRDIDEVQALVTGWSAGSAFPEGQPAVTLYVFSMFLKASCYMYVRTTRRSVFNILKV